MGQNLASATKTPRTCPVAFHSNRRTCCRSSGNLLPPGHLPTSGYSQAGAHPVICLQTNRNPRFVPPYVNRPGCAPSDRAVSPPSCSREAAIRLALCHHGDVNLNLPLASRTPRRINSACNSSTLRCSICAALLPTNSTGCTSRQCPGCRFLSQKMQAVTFGG